MRRSRSSTRDNLSQSEIIGVDLDNTIINYERMFYDVGTECGFVPRDISSDKDSVKAHLQRRDRNDLWTELQGLVYGKYLAQARMYSGFGEFLQACLAAGIRVRIISHKTHFNVVGEKTDLRQAAMQWLHDQRVVGAGALRAEDVFFLSTRAEKVARIAAESCAVFVDDLPEVFLEPGFPGGVRRILFAAKPDARLAGIERAPDWQTAQRMIFAPPQP